MTIKYEAGISESGWQLVVSFPDQSPSFAHGVEAGKIWARLDYYADLRQIEETTMTENREVLRRIAEYRGWKVEVVPTEVPGWDMSKFTKIEPSGTRINPHGLHIVAP
jgi:hypothetical protein